MKYFFYKVKEDLKNLFRYPDISLKEGPRVDYDKYWEKRRKGKAAVLTAWQKERADLILTMIEPGSRVMDVGCGDGAILRYLMEKGRIEGVGVDLIQSELDKAKVLGIETHLADLRDEAKLRALPEADYILGLEILEHMPEPEALIMILKAKARKGMIFSFPNTGYYLHRLRLMFGRFPLQWILHPGEHLRYWTMSDVKWWARSLSLPLERLIAYQGLPGLNKLMPSLFGQGLIFKLRTYEK